ncbi:MAG: hemolysin family protein [Cryomorphaceae bacterium]|jgi:putative hemolysin|nr:hemolysin family protein [Cryomorphaceae bacterium]
MDPSISVVVILISLLFSAFFSGMEIAFLASNRLKVELERNKGTLFGNTIDIFYRRESTFIAFLLLGNNIALVLFGMYAAELLDPIIKSWGIQREGMILFLQTTLSTLLVLITAEFLPKAVVQLNPNRFLRLFTYPMFMIYIILYIPTQVVLLLSTVVLGILRVDRSKNAKVFSKIDLENYVQELSERINEEEDFGNEMQILQNALDFSNIKARDCMIPRTEIIALEVNDDIVNLRNLFIETGLSKIIIYRDSIDNIIGYVHSFEMFKQPTLIRQILIPISFVPSALPGKELLEMFTKKSSNISVVVDEYGGTAGIITIEDVIEEIFGEIEDEHDKEDWLEEKISEHEYRFSARADIDYLNEEYDLELPESESYETLGGLILNEVESIPSVGQTITLEDHTFIIEQVSDRRIEVVRVHVSK